MSSKEKKKEIVPKLRFPEFKDAGPWEVKKLGEIVALEYGASLPESKRKNGDVPVVGSNGVVGYHNKALAKGPTIVIGRKGSAGEVNWIEADCYPIDTTFYVIFRRDKDVRRFIYLLLQNAELSSLVRLEGVPGLNRDDAYAKRVAVPKATEQQKIADFLSSLDEVIELEAKKLEALKAHKKGLMQQLFPREGETTPRRRFPEFQDAGEWEVKRLGEVCEILDNMRRPVTSTKRKSGPYPYYGASGVIDYIDEYIFDERLLLIGEDGAKWGPFEKTAFIVDGKYWVNNHAHVLRPTQINDVLLENYLNVIDVSIYVTGAAPPKLTLDNLRAIRIPVPPKPEEQQKIADCLSSLDELIELETKKLEALKAHKKGLMQQLFPQEVD